MEEPSPQLDRIGVLMLPNEVKNTQVTLAEVRSNQSKFIAASERSHDNCLLDWAPEVISGIPVIVVSQNDSTGAKPGRLQRFVVVVT